MAYSLKEIVTALKEIEQELPDTASAGDFICQLVQRMLAVTEADIQDGLTVFTAELRREVEESFLTLVDLEDDMARTLSVPSGASSWEELCKVAATGNPRALAWYQHYAASSQAARIDTDILSGLLDTVADDEIGRWLSLPIEP